MFPLCGELNTTGPFQSAGSRISNGGSSSSRISLMGMELRRVLRGGGAGAKGVEGIYGLLSVPLSMACASLPRTIESDRGFTTYLPAIRLMESIWGGKGP